MKVIILRTTGLVEKGEVYTLKNTRTGKALISVNGTDIDINKYLSIDGYDIV